LLLWPEVASLAVEKWGLAAIAYVLGNRTDEALPQLVRPCAIVVSLPAFQVEMLVRLARRGRKSLDAFLSSHLLDLAGSIAETIEAELPGFTAAMRWPDE
jgi:hypothetical protein